VVNCAARELAATVVCMTADERARARRASWSGGLVTPDNKAAFEAELWRGASVVQKLATLEPIDEDLGPIEDLPVDDIDL